MNKYSGYETCNPSKPPIAELVAPIDELALALLSLFGSCGAFFGNKIRRCYDEFVIARTAAELSRLDDHILRDIGIHRGEIQRIARAAVEDPSVYLRIGNHRLG